MSRLPRTVATLLAAAALAAATLASLATPAAAQSDESAVDEGAVQVAVEISGRSGRASDSVEPGQLEAALGQSSARVVSLSKLSASEHPPLIVLYFDYALSRSGPIQRVSDQLRLVAEELIQLGAVEIVVADPEARTVLPATRDLNFLSQSLDRIFVSARGEDALGERRKSFLEELQDPGADGPALARTAMQDELLMLRLQQDELLRYLSDRARSAGVGTALLVVNEGLGADPLDFYLSRSEDPGSLASLATRLPSIEEMARTANAYGWALFPLSEVGDDGGGRLRYDPTEDTPVGFRLRLGGRGESEDEEEEGLFEPALPRWAALAAATGGRSAGDTEQLQEVIGRLAGRYLVELELPHASDRAAALDLSAPERRLEVRAPNRLPGATPESVAELRARRALDGEFDDAELEVLSRIELASPAVQVSGSRLETQVRLADAEGEPVLAAGRWRVTVGVHTQDDEIVTRHEVVPIGGEPDDRATLEDDVWSYRSVLVLPPGTDSAAVIVENLDTGHWGASLADFVDRLEGGEATTDLPTPERPLRLVPLDSRRQSGRVTFRTVTTPEVSRVVFLLNGKRVARRSRPPFEARIDLGSSGRTMQLVAVALDRAGNELDRDRLVINEPPESFWVRIVEPEPGGRYVGATDVEARLKVPRSGAVSRVEFYWKDRRLATATEPPYRRQVPIPLEDPEGFLRVEAHLVDGRMAEDVLVVNRPGFGEQIGVELVELYLVASDRDSKPVLGLDESDFQVFEERTLQEIESFEVAGDLPLTLGLAIDSSSSLFLRMPDVKRAAQGFVDDLMRASDRAFLVAFGSEPEMVRSISSKFDEIKTGIRSLEPYGATAIWGGLGLALEQLDGMTGRRALVAFYDGDDEDEEHEFERSLRMARRARLPIYLILMNNAAARTQGRSLSSRAFVNKLDRIARAGGGRVFYVTTEQDLGEIFSLISEELRSHYLITYYPIHEPGGPLWRPVKVEVQRNGVSARTIEGRGIDW